MKAKTKPHDAKIEWEGDRARIVCSCGFVSSWVDPKRIVVDKHLKAYVIK